MASIRIERLQKQIRQKIASVLCRDLADPRIGLVTIIRVDLASDLTLAKVYWSSLEEGGGRRRIEQLLNDARGFIQREVAAILKTRTTPHLEFIFDPSIEGADRVARLIRDARREDDSRSEDRGEVIHDEGEQSEDALPDFPDPTRDEP